MFTRHPGIRDASRMSGTCRRELSSSQVPDVLRETASASGSCWKHASGMTGGSICAPVWDGREARRRTLADVAGIGLLHYAGRTRRRMALGLQTAASLSPASTTLTGELWERRRGSRPEKPASGLLYTLAGIGTQRSRTVPDDRNACRRVATGMPPAAAAEGLGDRQRNWAAGRRRSSWLRSGSRQLSV